MLHARKFKISAYQVLIYSIHRVLNSNNARFIIGINCLFWDACNFAMSQFRLFKDGNKLSKGMYIQKILILFSLAFSAWVEVIKPLYPSNSWHVMKQKVKMQQSTYLKKFSRVYQRRLPWSVVICQLAYETFPENSSDILRLHSLER